MAYLIKKKREILDKYTLSGLSPTGIHTTGFTVPISLTIFSTCICFKNHFNLMIRFESVQELFVMKHTPTC